LAHIAAARRARRSALPADRAGCTRFGQSVRVGTRHDDVREGVALFIVLAARGFALWVLIPLTFMLWLGSTPVRLLVHRRDRPSLRQYVTWADMTFVASLERGPLRRLVPRPEPFPAWPRERAEPPYRVGILDRW